MFKRSISGNKLCITSGLEGKLDGNFNECDSSLGKSSNEVEVSSNSFNKKNHLNVILGNLT